jgi:hypothetical protein
MGRIKKMQQFTGMLRQPEATPSPSNLRQVTYAKKVVLRSRWGYHPGLETLVAAFRRDGVVYVGVVGKDCDLIEDIIGEMYDGDSAEDDAANLLTSSHVDGTIEEAVSFARGLDGKYSGEVEVVEF